MYLLRTASKALCSQASLPLLSCTPRLLLLPCTCFEMSMEYVRPPPWRQGHDEPTQYPWIRLHCPCPAAHSVQSCHHLPRPHNAFPHRDCCLSWGPGSPVSVEHPDSSKQRAHTCKQRSWGPFKGFILDCVCPFSTLWSTSASGGMRPSGHKGALYHPRLTGH